MKLALVHNPQSGYNRTHAGRVPALAAQAGIACWQVSNPAELERAMGAIAATAPDLLIVNAGDGTVDGVVTCLRRRTPFAREPRLAVLAGGSTNMIARDVGLGQRPDRAWKRLMSAVAANEPGEAIARSPFSVALAAGDPGRLGFFLGGAALPALLRRTQKDVQVSGTSRGREALALARTVLRLLGGRLRGDPVMNPRLVQWTLDPESGRESEREEMVLFFVTSLDRLVIGIRAGQAAPSLRLVALRYPYRSIVPSVLRLVRGYPFHELGPNFAFRAGARLQFRLEGDLVLDGEPLPEASGTRTIELALERPLAFWRPAPN